MTDTLAALIDEISSHTRKIRMTGGAERDQLEALMALVGAALPPDYLQFLENHGTVGFFGVEIYGLIKGNLYGEGPPNCYSMTRGLLSERAIPDGHVVIGSSGYGPVNLLDCATGAVMSWSFEGSGEILAPSFRDYAIAELNQALKEWKAEAYLQ
jgi:hypothetical protein